jgi:hypothetical protein
MPDGTTFRSGPPVAVVSPGGEQGGSVLAIYPYHSMSVSYREYSDELARIVRESIAASGASVESDARRTIEVSVIHVTHAIVCYVHGRLETSSGYVRGFTGEAESVSRAKACNVAITRLAQEMVNDPGLHLFIEGGNPQASRTVPHTDIMK